MFASPLSSSPPLHDAIASMLESKTASGRRPAYVANLRHFLLPFAVGRNVPISSITVADVEAWIGQSENRWSRSTRLSRLSTLFSFALRRGWIASNPCAQIDRISIDHRPPAILTPHRSEILIRHAVQHEPDASIWFALGLFAGVRPSEADRLTWEAIRADVLVIDAAASKVRRRRIVHLRPAAVSWIEAARAAGSRLPVPYSTRRRAVRRVREAIGLTTWPADILRHTAASYWLAIEHDAGRLELALGNSPGILLRHYRELVSAEDAARFWAIAP